MFAKNVARPPVDWAAESFLAHFPTVAPLEVDLGCGDGAFLATLAEQNSARNFLGLEQLAGRVRSACRKIETRGLTNARIICVELSVAVERLLPPDSVDVFHLMFPDPWPKRRHHRRRIFTREFLRSIQRALKPGGDFRIATDHSDYFKQIERVVSGSPDFQVGTRIGLTNEPVSTFEKHFLADNTPIHRLVLRKIS